MNLSEWLLIRESVWIRDGGRCGICLLPIERKTPREFHVDHVIPRYQGGTDELSNLRATHKICNTSRKRPGVSVKRREPMFHEPTRCITVALPQSLADEIRRLATADSRTTSSLVRLIIEEWANPSRPKISRAGADGS